MFDAKNGGRFGVQRFGVMITDGEANIDASLTFKEAVKTHQDGIKVVVVGAGQKGFVDSDQINAISSQPTSVNVIPIASYYSLLNASAPLLQATCNSTSRS